VRFSDACTGDDNFSDREELKLVYLLRHFSFNIHMIDVLTHVTRVDLQRPGELPLCMNRLEDYQDS
jgi:hypothetical protein